MIRLAVFLLIACSAFAATTATKKLDFNRDVRPILSDLCFHCHGPDDKQRKGALNYDQAYEDAALEAEKLLAARPSAAESGEAEEGWRLHLEGVAREIDATFAREALPPTLATLRQQLVETLGG